jgi:inositol-phosphate phosphatase/L-galactose 1-phosphate phosphatase/histidinol-phosphatase
MNGPSFFSVKLSPIEPEGIVNPAQLSRFTECGLRAVDASSALIREYTRKPFDVEVKGDGSPSTSVDQAVEDRIREIISGEHPDHGVLGEERRAFAPDSEFVWAIDPIDGTLPFLAGIPVFGTLLALLHNEVPVLGIIDMPMTAERWIGADGRQTTRNGRPVRTRGCADLSLALMSTSNPDYYDRTNAPALERLKRATRFAVYGGSCMFYAQIASGRVDICIDVAFKAWDYMALIPVVQGAGGVFTDWQGRAAGLHTGSQYIAAGDPRIHEQALKILAD